MRGSAKLVVLAVLCCIYGCKSDHSDKSSGAPSGDMHAGPGKRPEPSDVGPDTTLEPEDDAVLAEGKARTVAPTYAVVGDEYRYRPKADRAGQVTWTVVAGPAGFSADEKGDELSFTPDAKQAGSQHVEIEGMTSGKDSITQTYELKVATPVEQAKGELKAAGGKVIVESPLSPIQGASVTVGPGAMKDDRALTLSKLDEAPPAPGTEGTTKAVRFGPEKAVFEKPVVLALPLPDDVELDPERITAAHYDPSGRWEPLRVLSTDIRNRFVYAEAQHFSSYAGMQSRLLARATLHRMGSASFCAGKLLGRAQISGTLSDLFLSEVSAIPDDLSVLGGSIADLLTSGRFEGSLRFVRHFTLVSGTGATQLPLASRTLVTTLYAKRGGDTTLTLSDGLGNARHTLRLKTSATLARDVDAHVLGKSTNVFFDEEALSETQLSTLGIRFSLHVVYYPGDASADAANLSDLGVSVLEVTATNKKPLSEAPTGVDGDCDGLGDAWDETDDRLVPKLALSPGGVASTIAGHPVRLRATIERAPTGVVAEWSVLAGAGTLTEVPGDATARDFTPSEAGSHQIEVRAEVPGQRLSGVFGVDASPRAPLPECRPSAAVASVKLGESAPLVAVLGESPIADAALTAQWGLVNGGVFTETSELPSGARTLFTPTASGQRTVGCRVSDGERTGAVGMLTLTVLEPSANRPPQSFFVTPASTTIKVGEKVPLEAYAEDPDGDALTFAFDTASGLLEPGASTANTASATFSTTLPGLYEVRVTVKDPGALSREQRATILVIREAVVLSMPDGDEDGWPAGLDCDDRDAASHPGALDTCGDELDEDCSGEPRREDCDADGVTVAKGDCDDADARRHPGASETCDGVDNDCDGTPDNGFQVGATCRVGVGQCAVLGRMVCASNLANLVCEGTPLAPSAELCNGLDDDCDGVVDDGCRTVCSSVQYEAEPPTPTKDRVCKDLTLCTASEYELTAPTPTSDRVCKALTVCTASEYEFSAPTQVRDRVCRPLAVCTVSEYETKPPSAREDRACAPLTLCTRSQYESAAPTPTSDRSCAPLTVCTASQYESVAPTATRDRECRALTACTTLQYESAMPTGTSDRVCSPLTVCTASQYESVAPTATRDRECRALTVCTASQYESTTPTATRDRECSPLTVCTASQYESIAPTATRDRECSPLTVCTASQYESIAPTATRDRECRALTVCTASQYESTAPTATRDRECSPLTVCAASQYESIAPTATRDRECRALTVCALTEYESTPSTATSDRVCSPLTVCTTAQYESLAPTATSDRRCTPLTECSAAQYESVPATARSDRACTPLTVCGEGEIEVTPPTTTSDRVCAAPSTAQCQWRDTDHNPATPCVAAIQAAPGGNSTCALDSAGVVVCWGNNSSLESEVPVGLGPAKQIVAGRRHVCALLQDGTVQCWGENNGQRPVVPALLNATIQLTAGEAHTCALSSTGAVSCWGENADGQCFVPGSLGSALWVGAGGGHSCAVDAGHRVVCWGRNDADQSTVPSSLLGVRKLALGGDHTCAVDDQGHVTCWGLNDRGQSAPPTDLGVIVELSAGRSHTCALDSTGHITCWGENNEKQSSVPPNLPVATQLGSGEAHNCIVDVAGDVTCWGRNSTSESSVPFSHGPIVQVETGHYNTCLVEADTLRLICRGNNYYGQSDTPPGLGPVRQVSANESHTCVLDTGGSVTCWGRNGHGESDVPILPEVVQIATGFEHSCALDTAGAVHCWGSNEYGQSTVPAGLEPSAHLVAGGYYTCVLDAAGIGTCWGRMYGTSSDLSRLGPLSEIAGGLMHTCFLTPAGVVTCEGENREGQCNVPAGLNRVVQVVAASTHSCALDDQGHVTCWGYLSLGPVPEGLSDIVQIAARHSHTCARDRSGRVTCWGWGRGSGQCSWPGL